MVTQVNEFRVVEALVWFGGWIMFVFLWWFLQKMFPKKIDAWISARARVTQAEKVASGWRLTLVYVVHGEAIEVETIKSFPGGVPSEFVELVYQKEDPRRWDWRERHLNEVNLQQSATSYFRWILVTIVVIGGVVLLTTYFPGTILMMGSLL